MTIGATFLLLFGMAAVTYFTRRAFIQLPSHIFSPRFVNGLTFIPVGIFSALIFPSLFIKKGELVFQPLYFVASIVCLIVMMFTRNVFLSFGLSLLLVVIVTLGFLPLPK